MVLFLSFYINIQLLENLKIPVEIFYVFLQVQDYEKSRRVCVTVFRPAPYRDGIIFNKKTA